MRRQYYFASGVTTNFGGNEPADPEGGHDDGRYYKSADETHSVECAATRMSA